MRYKAVLFDMDGTVLDTLSDLTDSVNHTLRQYGMPERSSEEVASFLGNGAARLISLSVPAGTGEELCRRVLGSYQPWYSAHCRIKTAPYPGILALMERLRSSGAKLAVISNKGDDAVKALAAQHFPGLLELAVGESAAVRRKPDPDACLAAMSAIGAGKADTVYIGDTEVDVVTAANAGVDCAAVSWGFRSRAGLIAAGASHIFDSPEALGDYLLE